MPLYEYKCSACGEDDEYLQKFSDPEITLCPHCGKETLKRQVSATRFQLKGTGWYETDFKNKNQPEKKAKKTEEGVTETKTDTSEKTPEKTPPAKPKETDS